MSIIYLFLSTGNLISHVTSFSEIMPGSPDFLRFRRLMTSDVNAAVQGAVDAGADEVVVTDAHAEKRNILIEELHPDARLVSGTQRRYSQLEGIDEDTDGVMFVGYHARMGVEGAVLAHTMWPAFSDVCVNGLSIGEAGINTYVAGELGVPVIMVSGDDKVAKESIDLLGDVEQAVVKIGIDEVTAECLPPARTSRIIRKAAKS